MRLFDESTLRKLSRLTLLATEVRSGMYKGERRSTKRGASLEFADYRNYTPGDDLRRLDWNVYARLDRPFLKLFEEEEDLAVHILVDISRSMDWGEGETNKFQYALRLGGALGAIALAGGDQLSAVTLAQNAAVLSTNGAKPGFGPVRGQGSLMAWLQFLENQAPHGATDLNAALRAYALAPHRPGLAFLVSDLFSPAGFQDGIIQIQGRGDEVVIVHILSPDEIDPPLAGDLRLLDVETGHAQDVSLDGPLRTQYRDQVLAWREETRAFCRRRGLHYLSLDTSRPWDEALEELVHAGLARARG